MASRLQDVILRGLAASKPAATAVAPGTLYFSTDTSIIERSNGTAWESYSVSVPIDLATQVTGDLPLSNLTPATAANKLLGRGSAAGAGDYQEISLGSGLTMTGTVLDVLGSGINQLTGDVTAGPGSGSQAATIANDAVTFAKIQNITTDRLLGRDTASSGDTEEIPVSSGLEFTGGPGLRVKSDVRTEQIGITVDGGGSVLTSGVKGYKSFPVAGTITGWRMLADVAGAVAMEIKKSTYSGFPGSLTSITAAAPPAIAATNQKAEDTTLTGWTTSVSAGDVFEFSITGTPATITRVTLEVTIVITG